MARQLCDCSLLSACCQLCAVSYLPASGLSMEATAGNVSISSVLEGGGEDTAKHLCVTNAPCL